MTTPSQYNEYKKKLSDAILKGNLEEFKKLVTPDIDFWNENGPEVIVAIMFIVKADEPLAKAMINDILKKNPEIKPQENAQNPLNVAISEGQYEIAEILVENFAQKIKDHDKKTPLDYLDKDDVDYNLRQLRQLINDKLESSQAAKSSPSSSAKSNFSSSSRPSLLRARVKNISKNFQPTLETIEENSDTANFEITIKPNTDNLENSEFGSTVQTLACKKLVSSPLEQPSSGQVVETSLPNPAFSHRYTGAKTTTKLNEGGNQKER